MSDQPDTSPDDLPDEALGALATAIAELSAEGADSRYIACAVIEVMRGTELMLHLGKGNFEQVLEEIHRRLEQFAKPEDTIITLPDSRFCVILRTLTSHDHLELATAKLRRLLSPPVTVGNHSVLVQSNAGFALMRLRNAQPSTLLQAAESALQRCTPAERYVVYNPETAADGTDGWDLKFEIENALDKGELVPCFEPVISTATGSVTAGYATLAWHSPKFGLQQFDKLVGAASDCGVLRPVYRQYIKASIGQAAKWSARVSLAIPLPIELLNDDEVIQQIEDAMEIYSVKPTRVIVEVEERVLASVPGRTLLENLRLKKVGIRIAGVGDGGLPLAHIGKLPADEIAFSRSMLGKSVPPALRRLIFEMFKRAGLKLVATDVKEVKLIQRFKDLGFQSAQGSAVGPILPYGMFAKWLRQKISNR